MSVILLALGLALTAPTEASPDLRRIQGRFLAPCCWRESLAVHQSPDADAVRAELLQLFRAGKTEDEIVAFYVARYGQRILREPQGKPAIWLTTVPIVVALAGLLVLAIYLVHAYRSGESPIAVGAP